MGLCGSSAEVRGGQPNPSNTPKSLLRAASSSTGSRPVVAGGGGGGRRYSTARLNAPGAWDVFISHTQCSDQGRLHALSLWHTYTAMGLSVWLDVKMKSQSIAAMEEGVKNSRCVIIVVTGPCIHPDRPEHNSPEAQLENATFNRWMCRKELRWAVESFIPIQPVIQIADKPKIGKLMELVPSDLEFLCDLNWEDLNRSNERKFRLGAEMAWEQAQEQITRVRKSRSWRRRYEESRRMYLDTVAQEEAAAAAAAGAQGEDNHASAKELELARQNSDLKERLSRMNRQTFRTISSEISTGGGAETPGEEAAGGRDSFSTAAVRPDTGTDGSSSSGKSLRRCSQSAHSLTVAAAASSSSGRGSLYAAESEDADEVVGGGGDGDECVDVRRYKSSTV